MKLRGYEHMKFYTKKEFHKKYPKGAGGYTVIGAVGAGVGKGQAPESILVKDELVEYFPYKEPGVTQEICGYLEAGDHALVYIAVMKSRAWKLWLMLLAFLAVLSIGVYTYFNTPAGVQLDPNSGKYKAPIELPDNVDESRISLPGYSVVYVTEGETDANLTLWNPETNPCYFKYSIRLVDTGEVFYESGYIAPGDAIEGVEFTRSFENGTYPIILSISTYALTDYEQQMNGGEMNATLIVTRK